MVSWYVPKRGRKKQTMSIYDRENLVPQLPYYNYDMAECEMVDSCVSNKQFIRVVVKSYEILCDPRTTIYGSQIFVQ